MLTWYDWNYNKDTDDNIGNPGTYMGASLTWFRGRMLKNYAKGDTSEDYTYDSNGVRLSKTVNDVAHSYFINGTQILSEKVGNDVYTYLYDATGIAGIRHNDKYYYFLKTQQGDIKYIADEDGILQAEYVYDAWGQLSNTGKRC